MFLSSEISSAPIIPVKFFSILTSSYDTYVYPSAKLSVPYEFKQIYVPGFFGFFSGLKLSTE